MYYKRSVVVVIQNIAEVSNGPPKIVWSYNMAPNIANSFQNRGVA